MRHYLLDIIFVEDCFEKRLMREGRLYKYLSTLSADTAGYIVNTPQFIQKTCIDLSISRSSFYRQIKKITELNWIKKENGRYKVTGIKHVRNMLGLVSRSCVKFSTDILSSYKRFLAFCLAAYSSQNVLNYKKWKKKNDRQICKLPGLAGNQGFFALSLISKGLEISKGYASKIRRGAIGARFMSAEIRYKQEFGLFPSNNAELFKKCNPSIAHLVQTRGDLAFVRDCDLLTFLLVHKTRRKNHLRLMEKN